MNLEVYEKAYYFDSKAATIFGVLRFVARAAGTDWTRPMMMGRLLVEDGKAIATDGRRMHFAELPTSGIKNEETGRYLDLIEPGDYRILANSAKAVAIGKMKAADKFPNYKAVLPVAPVVKTFKYRGWPRSNSKFIYEFTAYCHHAGKFGACLMSYLGDLAGHYWEVNIRSQDEGRAVEFTSGSMTAVIMPLNIDD